MSNSALLTKTYKCLYCHKENPSNEDSGINKYCDSRCQSDFEFDQYNAAWKIGWQETIMILLVVAYFGIMYLIHQ